MSQNVYYTKTSLNQADLIVNGWGAYNLIGDIKKVNPEKISNLELGILFTKFMSLTGSLVGGKYKSTITEISDVLNVSANYQYRLDQYKSERS